MQDIDERGIARWRLHSQGLAGDGAADDAAVVQHLLGVQAENHDQATWAVATRTAAPDRQRFAQLHDDGAILRTHVLRPTWHYVTSDDIRWLLELTAPRSLPSYRQAQAEAGLSDADVERGIEIVEAALAEGVHLTRDELGDRLADEGLDLRGQGLGVVLGWAELTGVVCSGRRRGRHHTYALLRERAPHARRLDRDEALAELALRYMTGHGPATERDLAYWASLTLTDARAGLCAASDQLAWFELDGRTYWHAGEAPAPGPVDPAGHLLQILDELYRGYQDSRHVLDADRLLPPGREAALGMAVVDGQLVARGRRSVVRDRVCFELTPLRPLADDERDHIEHAAVRYGEFLELPAQVALAPCVT